MDNIAVLLAAYNGRQYIDEMLASLAGQTYLNITCYIHDDGSDDGTQEIIRRWAGKDSRIRVLEGPPKRSPKANFLWMLGQIEADYYMFADQDDVWLADKVEKTMAAMQGLLRRKAGRKDSGTADGEANREDIGSPGSAVACIYTDMYVADEHLRVISDSFIRHIGREPGRHAYQQVLLDNPAAGCTMLFTRALRDRALGYRHPEAIPMHDVWVLLLAAIYGQVGVIDEPLAYYRQHGSNEMGAVRESFFDKLGRNLHDIFCGVMRDNKRAFLDEGKKLAREALLLPDMPENIAHTLGEYADISRRPKHERVAFYIRNGFLRAKGNLWMLFWV